MRGKVLRIVLDLLSMTGGGTASAEQTNNVTSPRRPNGHEEQEGGGMEGQAFGKDVWDWWNMVSHLLFALREQNQESQPKMLTPFSTPVCNSSRLYRSP
jgi:hypothetical protein